MTKSSSGVISSQNSLLCLERNTTPRAAAEQLILSRNRFYDIIILYSFTDICHDEFYTSKIATDYDQRAVLCVFFYVIFLDVNIKYAARHYLFMEKAYKKCT